MGERGMDRLSQDQLAEGARLLAENLEARGLLTKAQTQAALIDWFWANRVTLLSASNRAAEVEGCVREAIEKMRAYREQYTEDAKSQTGDEKEYSLTMAGAFIQAACGIINIAAEHNIDLSEPTPAGENHKGE